MYTDDMMNARVRMGNNGCSQCGDASARMYGNGCDNGCDSTYSDAEKYSCGYERTWGLDGYPVGMVFAPLQSFDNIHDLDTAMKKGTIFSELDLPFMCGEHSSKGGCCNG